MSSVQERLEALPAWGIEPVPEEHRHLSGVDLAILWGDLGIGLLVMVTGALLVPALGFFQALVVIVIGTAVGVGLLALAGVAGADHGVPTMVLFRPVLGIRGSWLPSGLNVVQLIGWTAVELWAMAEVANIVARRYFDFSARWFWLALIAAICAALAIWGPVGVARVWMKRFGAWIIAGISAVVTVMVLASGETRSALGAAGTGGWPTFGSALDLVIAMPISWLPLVADYNRFARGSRGAFGGTFIGYFIANVWLFALGAMLILAGDASASPAGIAAGILAVGGGSLAGVLLLTGLLFGETDEAFADIYSGAVSIQNIVPKASQRVLIAGITVISAALAALLTMTAYEVFLFLIGSVFVPLFGVLACDYFLARHRQLDLRALYDRSGPYWYQSGIRLTALLPWFAGFTVYHWIAPTGPDWWIDLWSGTFGPGLSTNAPWLAASLPSFAAAFLLAWLGTRLSSRSPKKEV
ncbi:MAG: putative hydroxymethylpyrimidine transporter CytX [Actinobacteria bacterium]|nr:putative hydroxymethylpyrimidine transporter CytX [Actinomycetota bacterium]